MQQVARSLVTSSAHQQPIHVLVVEKQDGEWVLYLIDEDQVLHAGGFVETWTHAQKLASNFAPSQIVALNDEGQVVVQELVGQRLMADL